jgi:hypothetical protein
MGTFLSSQNQFTQRHFTVVEIDLPVVEGIAGGYGTPLSSGQASNATMTYKFTDVNAPILPESGIFRYIKNITENTAKLQSGRGLGSRGSANIQLIDFKGDPNPNAPSVTNDVKAAGTYLAKLSSRNIFANREVRIKNYRVESDGSIDLENGAETRYYISESFDGQSGGVWNLRLKDELSRVELDESVWPIPLEGSIRTAVNSTVTTIPVDANVTYLVNDTVRVGEEFMKVSGVSGIGTGSATITVGTRGTDIVYTNTLTENTNSAHDVGDEVFVCEVSDDDRIDDLLERILLDIGIDGARIPKADWTTEVDIWHPTTRINTLWYESESTGDILEKILSKFFLDMWFDPVAREIKLSAVSVWKQSKTKVTEGSEIKFESIKRRSENKLRATRAFIVYDKKALATSESVENYHKASTFKREDYETSDFYGEAKTHRGGFSSIIDKDAADLWAQRYVSRYLDPFSYTWQTDERKLNFNVGDVVDIESSIITGFNGSSSTGARTQITQINPKYTSSGRYYQVSSLTYEPVFATNSEIVITGNVSNINLYNQYAGAPPSAVNITFVFDAVKSSSSDKNTPSIKMGAFPVGSNVTIILVNGCDLQAKGGNGGGGEALTWDAESASWIVEAAGSGKDGGIVFDCEGVTTDFYFSGATTSAAYPTADGYIRAPSGGDGGFNGSYTIGVPAGATTGNGGNAGDGRSVGDGGEKGFLIGIGGTLGVNGNDGSEFGISGWGIDGVANDATAGIAGSGVIDSGGTVTFYGSDATRYINGNGDH